MSEGARHLPEERLRRSFLYRDLQAAGARFRPLNDAMVATSFGDADETGIARKLGLADLSPLPRTGFKGPKMAEWMAAQGITLGEASNVAYPASGGLLAARLAAGEVLVLCAPDGDEQPVVALERAWSYAAVGVWPVPRRDASFWFMVTGEHAATIFAKICGVDLRAKSFANHRIAQTSVARSNGIVIRSDLGDVPAYHLLGDSASAGFAWESVLDTMKEFGGSPIGLDALHKLAAE
jgi:sarcosine oxidase, subunit gamma